MACRASFCHLLGLGQVGHSPRGTIGSAGTLDWGQCGQTPSPLAIPNTPYTPWCPLTASTPLGDTQCPCILPIPLLAPEYLHSLPAPIHHWHPYTLRHPMLLMTPTTPTPLGAPQCPLMPPIPLLVVNCYYFATDHLHTVKMLIFYRHFQLSSLCNWPSSWVSPVYKIQSLGVKNTSSVLWSTATFCSISKNMHYKDPVASQHWETNKVVWTWKDVWPPWWTSAYKRPFIWEGNYLVPYCPIWACPKLCGLPGLVANVCNCHMYTQLRMMTIKTLMDSNRTLNKITSNEDHPGHLDGPGEITGLTNDITSHGTTGDIAPKSVAIVERWGSK